ncbi:ribosomal protein S18-alanine N-acetyltransferase [Actinomycetospora chiangmaiensis]|uniref:ribosomal protein S18-alanine N-acetyltransferase n=1 Tax=Actinomycetospora chiangmaiensis TaxID=402650 RepID=UPI003CCC3BEA
MSPGDSDDAALPPGEVVLDALTPADAPACARLEALLFPGDDPWSAAAFRSELHVGHPYVAARVDGRLVGYAGVALLPAPAFSREPAEAEVHTIGVDPAVQGHGVGRRLLRALLERADAIGAVTYLEVRTDNVPALALYRSEGFEVVGTRRRYYASGADAHTMRRGERSDG